MVAGLRLNNSSAWAAFDKMEEKVMAMESEAESAGLLATPDNIEAQFARLEGGCYKGLVRRQRECLGTCMLAKLVPLVCGSWCVGDGMYVSFLNG